MNNLTHQGQRWDEGIQVACEMPIRAEGSVVDRTLSPQGHRALSGHFDGGSNDPRRPRECAPRRPRRDDGLPDTNEDGPRRWCDSSAAPAAWISILVGAGTTRRRAVEDLKFRVSADRVARGPALDHVRTRGPTSRPISSRLFIKALCGSVPAPAFQIETR